MSYVIKQNEEKYTTCTIGKICCESVSLGKQQKCCFPSRLELEGRSIENCMVEKIGVWTKG